MYLDILQGYATDEAVMEVDVGKAASVLGNSQ